MLIRLPKSGRSLVVRGFFRGGPQHPDGPFTTEDPGFASVAAMPGDLPELRASHEDRDRVVDTLRTAGGDGRLTAEELDARVERALSARTQGELVIVGAPGIVIDADGLNLVFSKAKLRSDSAAADPWLRIE